MGWGGTPIFTSSRGGGTPVFTIDRGEGTPIFTTGRGGTDPLGHYSCCSSSVAQGAPSLYLTRNRTFKVHDGGYREIKSTSTTYPPGKIPAKKQGTSSNLAHEC